MKFLIISEKVGRLPDSIDYKDVVILDYEHLTPKALNHLRESGRKVYIHESVNIMENPEICALYHWGNSELVYEEI